MFKNELACGQQLLEPVIGHGSLWTGSARSLFLLTTPGMTCMLQNMIFSSADSAKAATGGRSPLTMCV